MTDDLDTLLTDLADAAGRAAARGTLGGEAPATVHRITARVRRRRAVRHTGQGVAVACAAGALVAGGAQVRDALRTPFAGQVPAAGTHTDGVPRGTGAPPTAPVTSRGTGAPPTADPAPTPGSGEPTAGATSPSADAGPAAAIFRCGEPVHTTIHSLPDSHGLLLAAEDDLTAQVAGAAGVTWHAELPTAPRFAVLGADATVVALLVEDDDTRTRVDGTRPEQTYRLSGGVHVVGCEGVPAPTSGEKLVAWPYVSAAVYSDDADATPTPVVVVAEPREITVP
jgi:hypothetical protein